MAQSNITFDDKVTSNPQPGIPEINKVTGDNMTEIKTVVNANATDTQSQLDGKVNSPESIDKLVTERTNSIQTQIDNYNARLSDLNLTKSQYEALTEYENRNYILEDGSIYDVDTKTQDCNYIFNSGVDCLVTTTGDNGTGVIGDENFPFSSWEFVIDAIPIAGGVTIWIDGGSYSMNTTGVGYAILNRDFTNPVIVKSKPNETVILSHTLQVYAVRFLSISNNVILEGLTFTGGASDIATLYAAGAIEVSNFEVRDCIFQNGGASHNFAVQMSAQTSNVNNKTKRCTMETGVGLNGVFYDKATNLTVIGNKSNPSVDVDRFFRLATGSQGVFNISNNTINSTSSIIGSHAVFQLNDALIGDSTVNFNNNNVITKSEVMALLGKSSGRGITFNIIGNTVITESQRAIYGFKSVDSGEAKYNTITTDNDCLGLPAELGVVVGSEFGGLEIAYNNLTSTNHTLLCGENGLNNNVHDNILEARSGFYSFVCKGNGHLISSNLMYGGNQTALLFKNAENCISSNDLIIQEIALGSAVRFDAGLVFGSKNNSVTNANIRVTEGNLLEGIDGTNLGNGNFIDNNYYEVTGNGEWGIIYDNVTSLQELRRAWRVNVTGSQNNDLNSFE